MTRERRAGRDRSAAVPAGGGAGNGERGAGSGTNDNIASRLASLSSQ